MGKAGVLLGVSDHKFELVAQPVILRDLIVRLTFPQFDGHLEKAYIP